MTRSPRGRIKPLKSPSKQKIFGENNTKHISDLPLLFVFLPASRTPVPSPHPPFLDLYSSHFSPLCSAHSKDLLKKLSLEVSLLPKYPICAAALTPHTRNCICTYTPQMVSLLDLPPAEPRQAITTHKHTSSPLHLFFCYLLLFVLFCTLLPCPHGCILHKGVS
jgi:hypothetical protein